MKRRIGLFVFTVLFLFIFELLAEDQTPENDRNKPSETKAVEAKVEVEEKDVLNDEEKETSENAEKEKISIGLTSNFGHSIVKERPSFDQSILVTGKYKAPLEILISASTGFGYYYNYARKDSNADGTTGNASSYLLDGVPLRILSARSFKLPLDLKITPSAGISIPITSYYNWGFIENRASVNMGTSISKTFKLAKLLSMNLTISGQYSHSFDKAEALFGDNTHDLLWYRTKSDVLSDSFNMSLSYRDFSMNFLFRQDFNKSYDNKKIDGANFATYNSWQLQHTYVLDFGYTLKKFDFGIGFQTSGSFYKYGNFGPDALVPFSPEFTQIIGSIGYNFNFN